MNTLMGLWLTVRAMWRIVIGQNQRGMVINFWARMAILGVLVIVSIVVVSIIVWPFALLVVALVDSYLGTWFVAIVTLLPLLAIPAFVVILAILAAVWPLVSGILVAIPGVRRAFGVLFGWLAVAVFGELLIGLYLAGVPVWNNPGLIPVLVLSVVVLGMWLVLKRLRRWQRGRWFTTALVLAIAGITVSFFFSGGKEAEAREKAKQAKIPWIEEKFDLGVDEEKVTVFVGPGTVHRIQANKPWLAVSTMPDGNTKEYKSPAGSSSWKGGEPEGLLIVRGVEDGTTLRFKRVQ